MQRDAIGAIRHARELGINLFDTAQGYGFGASEQLLGQALRDELDTNREAIVIATKGGLRMTGNGLVRDSSRDWLRQGVDDSLRALGVDYIDLYQVSCRMRATMKSEFSPTGHWPMGYSPAHSTSTPPSSPATGGTRIPRSPAKPSAATELHLDEHALEPIDRIMTGAVALTGPAPELMPTS